MTQFSSNAELEKAYDATIEGLASALNIRDPETEGRSRKVMDLAVKLAQKMGLKYFSWSLAT